MFSLVALVVLAVGFIVPGAPTDQGSDITNDHEGSEWAESQRLGDPGGGRILARDKLRWDARIDPGTRLFGQDVVQARQRSNNVLHIVIHRAGGRTPNPDRVNHIEDERYHVSR